MPRAPERPMIVDEALLPGSKLTHSAEKSWAVRKADRQNSLTVRCERDRSFVQTRGKLSRTTSLPAPAAVPLFLPAVEDAQPREDASEMSSKGHNHGTTARHISRFATLPKAGSAVEAVRLLAKEHNKVSHRESSSYHASPSSPLSPASPSSPFSPKTPLSQLVQTSSTNRRGIGFPGQQEATPEKPDDYLMPKAVERVSYWSAIQAFDVSDIRRAGTLDRESFFHCVNGIMRAGSEREALTRERSDEIFSRIDVDDGGAVDKEEFLSWVFQTNSNYVSNVRSKLQALDPQKVQEIFKIIDENGNGVLERDEFWTFIEEHSPTTMTREESDALFTFIDADSSGYLDPDEFMNWIFPGRELRTLQGIKDRENAYDRWDRLKEEADQDFNDLRRSAKLRKKDAAEADEDDAQAAIVHRGIIELQPNKAVVLSFTISKSFEATLSLMKRSLRQVFSPSQVRFEVAYEPISMGASTCFRLEAKVGRGILFWDRASMISTQDDPFTNQDKAAEWVKEVLVKTLPDVLGAVNLRKAKRMLKKQRRKERSHES
eukprot:TRINITY_DN31936_c0_g1_i1.p1 TRINITY_DN31936_c0_g1~~TRINITY_DN31936_c0_g1_i1.p1  ORF type:complete len:546 (-),score=102.61 TRINITY_DN31936_c0_g1_i1:124-1761(-)